jgi:hypothetical protein
MISTHVAFLNHCTLIDNVAVGLKIADGSNHLTVVYTRLFCRDSFSFNSLPPIFRNLCSVISVSLVVSYGFRIGL